MILFLVVKMTGKNFVIEQCCMEVFGVFCAITESFFSLFYIIKKAIMTALVALLDLGTVLYTALKTSRNATMRFVKRAIMLHRTLNYFFRFFEMLEYKDRLLYCGHSLYQLSQNTNENNNCNTF